MIISCLWCNTVRMQFTNSVYHYVTEFTLPCKKVVIDYFLGALAKKYMLTRQFAIFTSIGQCSFANTYC